jgi:hypothetical protein
VRLLTKGDGAHNLLIEFVTSSFLTGRKNGGLSGADASPRKRRLFGGATSRSVEAMMAIVSHAFGGVKLSGADAKKFKNQALRGKPKAAAIAGVREGLNLAKTLNATGKVSVMLLPKAG